MGLLVSDLIDRVYNEWLVPAGINAPDWTTLTNNIAIDATSFAVDNDDVVPSHAVVEIDSELILTGTNSGSSVAANERGHRESAAAAHSAGAKVLIGPDFDRTSIFNALSTAIGGLYSMGLYQRTVDTSIAYNTSAPVDLNVLAKDVFSVRVLESNSGQWSKPLRKGWDYEVLTDADPIQIQFYTSALSSSALRVSYKSDFALPTAESDDLTADCGVPETLAPYLAMPAAGYLLMGREIPRVQIEELRRALAAQDVPVGNTLNVGQALLSYFRQKYVQDELRRQVMRDRTTKAWVR